MLSSLEISYVDLKILLAFLLMQTAISALQSVLQEDFKATEIEVLILFIYCILVCIVVLVVCASWVLYSCFHCLHLTQIIIFVAEAF